MPWLVVDPVRDVAGWSNVYMKMSAEALSTITDALRYRAERLPHTPQFSFLAPNGAEAFRLTSGELDRNARAVAALLQSFRAEGERVVLFYPPGPEFVSAFFGCLYAGAIAVPVPGPDESRPHRVGTWLETILADAEPAFGLTTSAGLRYLKQELGRQTVRGTFRWLATDGLPPDLPEAWWRPDVPKGSLAYLQYTSGSTSTPKGVMVSHENLLDNSRRIAEAWGYESESTSVMWVPHYHDDGLVHGIVQPVFQGFQAVILSPFTFIRSPVSWLRAISDRRATHAGGPNFAYAICTRKVSEKERDELELDTWRVAYNAAEPIRTEILERFSAHFAPAGFRAKAFYPAYGLAEATLLVSTKPKGTWHRALQRSGDAGPGAKAPLPRVVASCGTPVEGTTVRIVHATERRPCAPGEEGEVWLSGPGIASGYWRHAEENEATFGAVIESTGEGPFLRTGDLGFLHEGELFVSGRMKDLVIIRGQNHHPQDIEWTVQESQDAFRPGCIAAFSIDGQEGEELVVVGELSKAPRLPDTDGEMGPVGEGVDMDGLLARLRRRIFSDHGIHLHALAALARGALPKTSSGKIRRGACRNGYLDKTLPSLGVWT